MKPGFARAAVCAVFCLAGTARAGVIATDSTYADADFKTVTRAFNINAHGTVTDVNVTIDFSKCDDPPIGPEGRACEGIGRSFPQEISFQLVGPDGRIVDLVPFGTYQSGKGRFTVTYDDEALAIAGPALANGSFRPVNALSAFDGMDMFGSWQLWVTDNFPGDPLEYFGSRLEIGGDAVAAVPEPASISIVCAGLVGLAAARRLRRRQYKLTGEERRAGTWQTAKRAVV